MKMGNFNYLKTAKVSLGLILILGLFAAFEMPFKLDELPDVSVINLPDGNYRNMTFREPMVVMIGNGTSGNFRFLNQASYGPALYIRSSATNVSVRNVEITQGICLTIGTHGSQDRWIAMCKCSASQFEGRIVELRISK